MGSIIQFIGQLQKSGFAEMDGFSFGVRVLYNIQNETPYVLAFINESFIEEGYSTYNIIEDKINKKFEDNAYLKIEMLMIVSTEDIITTREKLSGHKNYWLIDTNKDMLIIYENQPSDFIGIRRPLENWLYAGKTAGVFQKRNITVRDFLTVTNLTVLINILVYIIAASGGDMLNPNYLVRCGGLIAPIPDGEYYRLFICIFLHAGVMHLAQNMLFLYIIGNDVEKFMGKTAFLCIYLGGGLISSIFTLIYYINQHVYSTVSVGASGACLALLGAMIVMAIADTEVKRKISLPGIIICAIMALTEGLSNENINNIAHFGGMVAGIMIAFIIFFLRKHRAKH
ncbi:MAG: rhomboid family intramembrane serine protease [Wujia sp.]